MASDPKTGTRLGSGLGRGHPWVETDEGGVARCESTGTVLAATRAPTTILAPKPARTGMQPRSENIVFHHGQVARADREARLGQRGCVLWFTGLSGSGKSTVCRAVETRLAATGHLVQVLDGDNVRHGLCKDLGFSAADRSENIRRIAEIAKLSVDVGLIVLTAFISPFRADRAQARAVIGTDDFIEVFLDVSLAVCEQRDPKGLYRKVRAGEIAEFTGISSPYEPPDSPEIRLATGDQTLEQSVDAVIDSMTRRGLLGGPTGTTP